MKRLIVILPVALALAAILVFGFVSLFPGKVYWLNTKIELAKSGLEEKSIDVNGLHFSYLKGGKGEPLLLLHGFSASKEHWLWIAKHLNKHFQIIAPDLPGCGSSTSDAGLDYSVEKQVERVRAFTQALGLTSFHIGGSSMGGNISGVFAFLYPDAVLSLWLIDPGGVKSAQPSEKDILLEKGENILVAKSVEDFDRIYKLCFVKPPYIPGFVKKYLAERAAADSGLMEKIYRDLKNQPSPLEDALRNCPTPTLILWGDQDRVTHVSGAAIVKSLMPNARAIVMKDIGHLPMLEAPELTAHYYLEFQKKK